MIALSLGQVISGVGYSRPAGFDLVPILDSTPAIYNNNGDGADDNYKFFCTTATHAAGFHSLAVWEKHVARARTFGNIKFLHVEILQSL